MLRLSILATLSGPLDAAKVAELSVDVRYGLDIEIETSVRELPGKGSRVVAFVERSRDGTFYIPTLALTFMPNHAAMFKVDGFDSAEVSKLIKGLRDVRKEYENARGREKRTNYGFETGTHLVCSPVSILYPACLNPSVDSPAGRARACPAMASRASLAPVYRELFASISHQPSPPPVPRETGVV